MEIQIELVARARDTIYVVHTPWISPSLLIVHSNSHISSKFAICTLCECVTINYDHLSSSSWPVVSVAHSNQMTSLMNLFILTTTTTTRVDLALVVLIYERNVERELRFCFLCPRVRAWVRFIFLGNSKSCARKEADTREGGRKWEHSQGDVIIFTSPWSISSLPNKITDLSKLLKFKNCLLKPTF